MEYMNMIGLCNLQSIHGIRILEPLSILDMTLQHMSYDLSLPNYSLPAEKTIAFIVHILGFYKCKIVICFICVFIYIYIPGQLK